MGRPSLAWQCGRGLSDMRRGLGPGPPVLGTALPWSSIGPRVLPATAGPKSNALRTITWEGQGNTSRGQRVAPSRLCPGRSALRTGPLCPRATSSQRPALCLGDMGRPSEGTLPLNNFELSLSQQQPPAECTSWIPEAVGVGVGGWSLGCSGELLQMGLAQEGSAEPIAYSPEGVAG